MLASKLFTKTSFKASLKAASYLPLTQRNFMNFQKPSTLSLTRPKSFPTLLPMTTPKPPFITMFTSRTLCSSNFDQVTIEEYMQGLEMRETDLPDQLRQDLHEVNSKLQEEGNRLKDEQVAVQYLEQIFDKMFKMRNPPLSEIAVTLNYCTEYTGKLQPFDEVWKKLERLCYANMSYLPPKSTVEIVYYFCKFQKATKTFWSRFDSKLVNDIRSLKSCEPLSKLLLALIMDDRENQELYSVLLTQIMEYFDEASSKDCFYIAVALSKGIIAIDSIPKDMFYTLYLNAVQYIDQYNLSDLAYFLMLFSTPYVQEQIPEEFWDNVVEPQLEQAIKDFDQHKENINIELFLDDYMRCFMAVAIYYSNQMSELGPDAEIPKASKELWENTIEVMVENIKELNPHTVENLIYSATRSRIKDKKLWECIAQAVVDKKLLAEDKINEFCLLLGILDNKIHNDELWKHLDEKFIRLAGNYEEVPTDLLALYANALSKVKTEEEQAEIWAVVDKSAELDKQNKYKQG